MRKCRPSPRFYLVLCAWGGCLYAIGGQDPRVDHTGCSSIDVYDIAAGLWSAGPALPGKRFCHSAIITASLTEPQRAAAPAEPAQVPTSVDGKDVPESLDLRLSGEYVDEGATRMNVWVTTHHIWVAVCEEPHEEDDDEPGQEAGFRSGHGERLTGPFDFKMHALVDNVDFPAGQVTSSSARAPRT
jgi:hypothetical protein